MTAEQLMAYITDSSQDYAAYLDLASYVLDERVRVEIG